MHTRIYCHSCICNTTNNTYRTTDVHYNDCNRRLPFCSSCCQLLSIATPQRVCSLLNTKRQLCGLRSFPFTAVYTDVVRSCVSMGSRFALSMVHIRRRFSFSSVVLFFVVVVVCMCVCFLCGGGRGESSLFCSNCLPFIGFLFN